MIELPDDAWERIRKRRRLSDTVESRRSFAAGIEYGLDAVNNDTSRHFAEVLVDSYQAMRKFVRDKC